MIFRHEVTSMIIECNFGVNWTDIRKDYSKTSDLKNDSLENMATRKDRGGPCQFLKVNVKVELDPRTESTWMPMESFRQICLTMLRPRPVPPSFLLLALSTL